MAGDFKPQRILWIDLEMTGLDAAHDRIVEVAAIVTDWELNELASFESGVGQSESVLQARFGDNPWAKTRPAETKKLVELSLQSPPEKQVAAEILSLIGAHFPAGQPVLLAGNSIRVDREFIKRWWPEVDARLHYRMLDVSAWKVVMQGKFGLEFEKSEAHRALGDIRESIAELQFYLSLVRV